MPPAIKDFLKPLAEWIEIYPTATDSNIGCYFFGLNYEPKDIVPYWFGKEGCEKNVIPFGGTGDGSFYAFWFATDTPPENTPIVYFGSEGDFYVAGKNYVEFLAVLSAGFEWEHDPDSAFPDSPELSAFREWVLTQGVKEIPDFAGMTAILEKANEAFPYLGQWIEERTG
jgi:hypothetical protein